MTALLGKMHFVKEQSGAQTADIAGPKHENAHIKRQGLLDHRLAEPRRSDFGNFFCGFVDIIPNWEPVARRTE